MITSKKKKSKNKNPSVGLYRRIALSFVIFTIVLLAIVFYLAFSSATITILPSEEVISTSFITTISNESAQGKNSAIRGKIFDQTFEVADTFQATGKKAIETDIIGTVTLYNNYTKDQPLVATTRLLSPDGQLFRLKNRVLVPAGESLSQVEIYADDQENVELPIAKMTRFTIPGLWEGLQDKIYAQNPDELTGDVEEITIVKETDISQAQARLEEELLTQAKEKFNSLLKSQGESFSTELTQVQLISVNSDASVGDIKDDFSVRIKANVVGVAFSRDVLKDFAIERLRSELPDDKELGLMDVSAFTIQLSNYDPQSMSADVQVYLESQMFLKHNAELLEKSNFVGKTKKEVTAMLTQSPAIKDVLVELKPFWLTRLPRLADHIDIVIKRTK